MTAYNIAQVHTFRSTDELEVPESAGEGQAKLVAIVDARQV